MLVLWSNILKLRAYEVIILCFYIGPFRRGHVSVYTTCNPRVASSILSSFTVPDEPLHDKANNTTSGIKIFSWTHSSCGASALKLSFVLNPVLLALKSGTVKKELLYRKSDMLVMLLVCCINKSWDNFRITEWDKHQRLRAIQYKTKMSWDLI